MRRLDEILNRVAAKNVTVLVLGETGVGKELVARTLHDRSCRADGPFVKVNCAALPPRLLESELFGYERGAFTGAERRNRGKFEQAHGGTIFLDEIAEMPLSLQAKLLHVLQDQHFSRLGSEQDLYVDVRIIAATNRDLARYVAEGAFREDLFYRLNVVNIRVPALRERGDEIDILVEYFLKIYSGKYEKTPPPISRATFERLRRYRWPGNVRELQNVVQRLLVLGTEAVIAELEELRSEVPAVPTILPEPAVAYGERLTNSWRLKELTHQAVEHTERMALKRTLEQVHWRRIEAARRLRISYKTLLNKIKYYELDRPAS
jgi:transcriptional regulator with PAS, ATPase and Fis domain